MPVPPLVLAAHTISGVMPGDPAVVRHDLPSRIAAAADAGFAGLCLHVNEYALLGYRGQGDAELRGLFARAGLSVPAIEFLGDWHHATPAATARRDLAFQAALALGAPVVTAGIDALDDAVDLKSLVPPLRDLCARADDLGLRIALEPVAWGQGKNLHDALELVLAAGGGAGLLVDIWHLAWRAIPPSALRDVPPDLVLGLQINDSRAPFPTTVAEIRAQTLERKLCGAGELDISGYLAEAAACGWHAPVAVEVMSPALAASDVVKAARAAYETAMPYVTKAWS